MQTVPPPRIHLEGPNRLKIYPKLPRKVICVVLCASLAIHVIGALCTTKMHLGIVDMIMANIYNYPSHCCSTMPQVRTSILHTFYTCMHVCSRTVARTRSDRVLHMLRTTRRVIRQNDRVEPLVELLCSMAAPGSLQGERSLEMCGPAQPSAGHLRPRTPFTL